MIDVKEVHFVDLVAKCKRNGVELYMQKSTFRWTDIFFITFIPLVLHIRELSKFNYTTISLRKFSLAIKHAPIDPLFSFNLDRTIFVFLFTIFSVYFFTDDLSGRKK